MVTRKLKKSSMKKTKTKKKIITRARDKKPAKKKRSRLETLAVYRDYSARIAALAKKQSEIIEKFMAEFEKKKIEELKKQL